MHKGQGRGTLQIIGSTIGKKILRKFAKLGKIDTSISKLKTDQSKPGHRFFLYFNHHVLL